MGRVASKRKLKQCDPFFKGTRTGGKKPKAYDLPPTESKRSKKRKRQQVDDAAVESFILRTSVVDGGGATGQKPGAKIKTTKLDGVGSIREGESMKDFNKRIAMEVKRVIYDESKKTRRKTEKRKEFLKKKKDKVKEKKMTDQERYEAEYQATGDTKRDTFKGAEKVRFGERVDGPPIMPKLKGIFLKRANAQAAEKAKAAAGAPKQKRPRK